MPRERGEQVVATNRRARHDYAIEKTYEAGLVLTGTEVKSLRQGRANLSDGSFKAELRRFSSVASGGEAIEAICERD